MDSLNIHPNISTSSLTRNLSNRHVFAVYEDPLFVEWMKSEESKGFRELLSKQLGTDDLFKVEKIINIRELLLFIGRIDYKMYNYLRQYNNLPKLKKGRKIKKNILPNIQNENVITPKENLQRLYSSIIIDGVEYQLSKKKQINNNECLCCYSSERNVALFPCGHVYFCSACSDIYKSNNCPVCRRNIEERRKIHLE